MKKIGLLCLAIVLALGTLGVGYAAWTDTITIDGTVNTGTVDLEVVEYSGLWMWKIPGGTPEYYLTDNSAYTPTPIANEVVPFVVAYSCASQTMDGNLAVDDAVTVKFDNLFPLSDGVPINGDASNLAYYWVADILVHYVGTVPVIASAEFTGIGPETDAFLYTMWDLGLITVKFYESDVAGVQGTEITEDVQMHNCDYVLCLVIINIPQNPTGDLTQADFMSLDGTFTAEITCVQWNEYPLP